MRIAIWHNLPSGGAKRALYYHAKGLIERGHTLEAWCPPTADQTYLPLSDFLTEHIVPLDWQPVTPPTKIVQGLSDYLSSARLLRAMDKHCRRCAAEINQKFDLLFANACMFFRAAPIGRYVSIPKVVYLPEPNRRLYEAAPFLWWVGNLPEENHWRWHRRIKYFLGDLLRARNYRTLAREEYLSVRAFDVILVNSLFSRESILRAYGLDAQICYLGIDTVAFCDQHLPREDFLLGVGAFVPEKNIQLVIEAVANAKEPHPRLVWVGNVASAAYLENLKQFAQSIHVDFEPKVRVTDRELVNLLNRATAMVYAPRLEPFGFAPLEANACGLPVIAVAEGGIRETVIHGVNGLLVEHDAQAMAQAIDHLRNAKDYARQLGENGSRLVAAKWSWTAAIDCLESRFAEAIQAPQQG